MTATVHRLPGVGSTPAMMLGMLQGWSDQIESLVVVVKWKEGGHQVCFTAQQHGTLAMASMVCTEMVKREIMG